MKLLCVLLPLMSMVFTTNPKAYHYHVFKRQDGGYGYSIYDGGKKIIQQETIPALSGNRGFASKADAAKVAELVISKLEQQIFPPTVSAAELERLHIW